MVPHTGGTGPGVEGPEAGEQFQSSWKSPGEKWRDGVLLQWWPQRGGLDGAAMQRREGQDLSTHEFNGDVREIRKWAPSFQSGWLSR